MKVLTATSQCQGPGDVAGCAEGEYVLPFNPAMCATCQGAANAGCVCARAFFGLEARDGAVPVTTTAMVRERDITLAAYAEVIRAALVALGGTGTAADEAASILVFLCRPDPPGTVITHQGYVFTVVR